MIMFRQEKSRCQIQLIDNLAVRSPLYQSMDDGKASFSTSRRSSICDLLSHQQKTMSVDLTVGRSSPELYCHR